MQETVGETLAKRLVAWGVDTVFGLPGDGINGLMEGIHLLNGLYDAWTGSTRTWPDTTS
ncbi:MAG TPA: thiamine pyrophosphate-binding protein [Kineosporiaceae bacterium]